jgi:hypothetical protein
MSHCFGFDGKLKGLAKAVAAPNVLPMKDFLPQLEVLPKSQHVNWQELAEIPVDFTFYGGTAIALHLGMGNLSILIFSGGVIFRHLISPMNLNCPTLALSCKVNPTPSRR